MGQKGSYFLKYRADWLQALVIVLSLANLITHWLAPEIRGWQVAISLFLSVPVAAIVHNVHHDPMWKFRPLNIFTDFWATAFYALPMSAWIAVHNQSHHRFHNNPDGDVTSTHFGGDRATIASLLLDIWKAVPGFYAANFKFMGGLWRTSRPKFLYQVVHWVFLYGGLIALLFVDWQKTLLLVILPQQASLMVLTVFNYAQHVSTRYDRPMETSRNFTSRWLNLYTFNSGLHVVHHLKPRAHWSLARDEYEKISAQVPPHLIEKSFFGFIFRNFIFGNNRLNGFERNKAA